MTSATPFRILAVDDEPDIRFLLESALADAYEVVTAQDGRDALLKISKVEPDLIILDLMMPEMDGWAVLKKLRSEPTSAKTPVILLSALNAKEDMKRGYQYGASVYLTKPFEVDRLRRNIALALEAMTPGVKRHSLEAIKSGRATPPLPFMKDLPAGDDEHESNDGTPVPPTARPTEINERVSRIQAAVESTGQPPNRSFRPQAPAPPTRQTVIPTRPSSSAIHGLRPGTQSGERPRAMILEAEAELIDVLKAILDQTCETFVSRDPGEAEVQVQTVEPDLLILAARLPKMTGYHFLEILHKNPVSAAIPVIFITEKDVYRERLAMMNKGVRNVVGKPVRPYEMSQIVQEILQDPNFVIRDKSSTLAELTLTAGKRKAVIEQKIQGRISKETVDTMGAFLRDNLKKD